GEGNLQSGQEGHESRRKGGVNPIRTTPSRAHTLGHLDAFLVKDFPSQRCGGSFARPHTDARTTADAPLLFPPRLAWRGDWRSAVSYDGHGSRTRVPILAAPEALLWLIREAARLPPWNGSLTL